MTVIAKFLGPLIKSGQMTLIHADGVTELFGQPEAGFPNVTLRLKDKKVVRDIMLDLRLGAAEAFMDGRLIIEDGDVMDMIQLIRSNRPWERDGKLKEVAIWKRFFDFFASTFDQINGLGRSKENVAHHYDLGNDLYRLFLDEDLQYTCAYFADDDMTLEQAQAAKKAHIAAKLALSPGQKVLDIGCGWGGLALYLNKIADVDVLGITLSEEQLVVANARAEAAGVADRVKFELMDYRDLADRDAGQFDRIVSVGMFEAVGTPQFKTFFRCCANLMTGDGVMLLHTIGRFGRPGKTDAFTRKYIFPGGYIPALSETLEASEHYRLMVTDMETLRLHYAKTLREWYQRTVANKEAIVSLYDERFFRMWTFYLAGATAAFESGGMCNYQIQFSRNRSTLPLTRDYIGETEKNLIV
ncbi:class I SAM-dependent methyltransferase [Parasphingorhabdus sp.]|uniref:class I SAM-dependent methyltransferase n=1 Tax=Parasphingorhabdus sp. TaxID=2709688 RepID=UPI003D2A01DC